MHLLRLDFEAPYPPFKDSDTKGFLLMAVKRFTIFGSLRGS